MENKKLFKKRIQEFVKEFANLHEFKLYKRTFAIENQNNLLQMVCFDFPPACMQCHVAIQPLYVPQNLLHFTFGNRLNYFKVQNTGLWGLDESKIEDDIKEISDLIEINVMPWFAEISSPQAFIEVIKTEKDSMIRCEPYFQKIYLGFSYLYIKDYDSAKSCLNEAISLSSERLGQADFVKIMKTLINLLDSKLYENIDKELSFFTETTKIDCKINSII